MIALPALIPLSILAPLELQCAKNAPKLDNCVPGARYRRVLPAHQVHSL
jgi:hypothetical protein